MKCEYCSKEHNGQYATGRFCNVGCARAFPTVKQRQLINRRVSEKLKGNVPWNKNRLGGFEFLSKEEIFTENTQVESNGTLRRLIVLHNIDLDKCNHDIWNEEPLIKDLHHKNGN